MAITSDQQLITYLLQKNTPFKSIEQLQGGRTNFVWRIITDSGASLIVKHAASYIAASAAQTPIQLSVERMVFEHWALSTLGERVDETLRVRLPKLRFHDKECDVLAMEDGGDRTLKEAYTDPSLNIQKMGSDLGIWLAKFHQASRDTDMRDNKTAKAIYPFPYNNLAAVFAAYGYDPNFGDLVNERYGKLIQTDDECVCHGDFWPGNLVLQGERMTVLDWELVRRGCGATDVGQFAAEAWLLDRFRGGRGLLRAFLAGYRKQGEMDEQFKVRVAVQMGVHLAFWPTRVEWGMVKDTVECVRIGWELLECVVGGEGDWVGRSVLKELL